ncbi:hypothetical protein HZU40_17220 [Mycolicibacterium fluoranthenivorans]|uniref:Uncharacterized protein n=1 Tax=Mycolicibacterium fluoranthenivorans TaxID=258505 RepID=A0A7G8P6T5_9MYCO|nr:hypothetical protein [Mycolicibacterium fluoranthenivorans]QNJ90051.1 hypothetical protein HZU40_17220 [Mycolicibacterium fluoranthenivorans]
MTTDATKALAAELHAAEPSSAATSEMPTDRFAFRNDHGNAPLSAEDQHLHDLRGPVISIADPQDTTIAKTDVEQPLNDLFTALKGAHESSASPELVDLCWHDLTRAANTIVRDDELSSDTACFELARDILLATAVHRLPETRTDPASFDSAQSWSVPAPRAESAGGLLCVASREVPVSDEVLGAINVLSADPSPEVRFEIAKYLFLLRRSADAMWHLIDEMKDDISTAVLSNLASALSRAASPENTERVATAIRDLLEHGHSLAVSPGTEQLRNNCMLALAALYIWHDSEMAREVVLERVSSSTESAPEDFAQMSRITRDAYAIGDGTSDGHSEAGIRARAIEFSRLMLESAISALDVHLSKVQDDAGDALKTRIRATAGIINGVASDLFIVSGAHEADKGREPEISPAQLKRLYEETAPLLDLLSEAPIAGVTHHVIETLSVCIPFNPKDVFQRFAHTVELGVQGDYQYDPLGAGLVVKVLKQYLSEHRSIFQTDSEAQEALIRVLDIFVDVGWPEANRLVFGLDDIFR